MKNTERYFFADVDLPFHVWVREGCRWVLRDAAVELQNRQASSGAEPPISSGRSSERSTRP
jgi:hypothetical protein